MTLMRFRRHDHADALGMPRLLIHLPAFDSPESTTLVNEGREV